MGERNAQITCPVAHNNTEFTMASLINRNGIFTIVYWDRKLCKRRWFSTHLRNEEDAKRYMESIIDSLEKPKRRLTLSTFSAQIQEYILTNLSKQTSSIYVRSLRFLQESVGDIEIRFLTTQHIEKMKQDRCKKVRNVTVNVNLRTIRAALNLATDWGLIENNPARRCKLLRVPVQDPVFLRLDEFLLLLKSVADGAFRRLFVLAVLTGLRRGEIANLCWEDLDFNRRCIRVRNRSTHTVKGMHPRTILMHSRVADIFQPIKQPSGYVFLGSKGRPINPPSITNKFKDYVRKCGLPDKLHFHSLRHTYASWLVQQSVPIYEVQKLLGHRSIATTEIYAHLEDEGLRHSIERLSMPTSEISNNLNGGLQLTGT